MVDGNSFENLAGMYGISGSDSNSISCFSFCKKSAVEGINLELLKDYLGLEINKNNFRIFQWFLCFCGIAGTYLYSVYCIISN